jgi:hypothetical protein
LPRTKANAQLADAAGTGDDDAATRVSRNLIDDIGPFVIGEQALGVGKIGRRFDDGLHRTHIVKARARLKNPGLIARG